MIRPLCTKVYEGRFYSFYIRKVRSEYKNAPLRICTLCEKIVTHSDKSKKIK